MSTLGEKVTETITGAVGKGLTGFTSAQGVDLKAFIAPRIEEYLAALPEGSVARAEMEHLTADSTFVDGMAKFFALLVGLIQGLWTMGGPTNEHISHAAWQHNPARYPGSNTVITAAWRGAYTPEDLDSLLRQQGYDEGNVEALKRAQRTVLDKGDIIDLDLRGELDIPERRRLFEAAGIDLQTELYMRKLAQRIPGVADIIRMAVKEVFTPETAEKFGQYADFPEPLAEWASKQGLSREWATRYWAAHWDLPSVSQGFEMLHRGVIDQATMDMLLKAMDVMPYWRDKINAIAYNPLSRVDLRRMYQLGIMTLAEVRDGYKKLGFDDANAARLTDYAGKYYGVEDDTEQVDDRAYTKAEILAGYKKKVITRDQTSISLQSLGYSSAQADFYIAQQELQVEQTRKDAYINAYQSLYLQGIASADEISTNLVTLGLRVPEINEYLSLWWLQRLSRVTRPTKAERTRWLKAGIITRASWTMEMQLDGYSQTYISWYLAEIDANPAEAVQQEALPEE